MEIVRYNGMLRVKADSSTSIVSQTPLEKRTKVSLEELGRLIICRRTELSALELKIYGSELAIHEPEDVTSALRNLSRQPREQYQTAMPDLGTLLDACQKARRERIEASYPPMPSEPDYDVHIEASEGPHYRHDTPLIIDRWKYTALHVGGARPWAYLDAEGNPTTHDKAYTQMLQPCACYKQWREGYEKWREDVLLPWVTERDAWQEQVNAIARTIRLKPEAA